MFTIIYSNGRKDEGHPTYAAAVSAVALEFEQCVVGHDGDLTSGGDRTLVWASEADSIDDDGTRAVASIIVDLEPGSIVESGDGEDYDSGVVHAFEARRAYVGWRSGVSTWSPVVTLRAVRS